VKISPVYPEIFDEICGTRNAISIRIFSSETTPLIFTKILHDVVALVALFNLAHTWLYPIPFLNDRAISAGGRQFCPIFTTKLVAMATSLKISEKGGRIVHLQFNIYHMVQRL